jgi:hypothetical protein
VKKVKLSIPNELAEQSRHLMTSRYNVVNPCIIKEINDVADHICDLNDIKGKFSDNYESFNRPVETVSALEVLAKNLFTEIARLKNNEENKYSLDFNFRGKNADKEQIIKEKAIANFIDAAECNYLLEMYQVS